MENKDKKEGKFLTPGQVAKKLGISRAAVHKRIKKEQLKAEKVNGHYFISNNSVGEKQSTSDKDKKVIEQGVKKVVREYKDALRMLGKE